MICYHHFGGKAVVVAGINNYNSTINFGAQTRSEREAARERAQERSYVAQLTAEEIREVQKRRDQMRAQIEKRTRQQEAEKAKKAQEKQYNEDVKDLKDTQKIIKDLTQSGKDKNILAGDTLKRAGKIADVVITGTLSGMALHWSTGKAFMMIHKVINKPKVANVLGNIKRPFQIIGSGMKKGVATAWDTMAKEVKSTPKGKKFVESAPIKKLNEGLDSIKTSYNNFKTDAKNLKAEDIKSGVATVFGVSGFIAGVVEKLDTPQKKSEQKRMKNAHNAD